MQPRLLHDHRLARRAASAEMLVSGTSPGTAIRIADETPIIMIENDATDIVG